LISALLRVICSRVEMSDHSSVVRNESNGGISQVLAICSRRLFRYIESRWSRSRFRSSSRDVICPGAPRLASD
jgi:hypothetical protein